MISGRFSRSFRLRKGSQFQAISNKSHTFYGRALFIAYKANGLPHARLGITVTKKFGEAHVRNRFKRLVREGFRQTPGRMEQGVDLNVRPKNIKGKNPVLPSLQDVVADFKEFFEKLA